MTQFDLILMDPPWPEHGGANKGANAHYETVPYKDIPAVVLGAPVWTPAPNAWIGCWATKSSLPQALRLLDICGAKYVTNWTWIKTNSKQTYTFGLGQYGRHCTEQILWGKRGVIGRNPKGWQSAMADRPLLRREHSRKPDEFYQQAKEIFAHTQALEMFARGPREGWTVWGLESGKESK